MCDTHGGPDPGYTSTNILAVDLEPELRVWNYFGDNLKVMGQLAEQCTESILAAAKLMTETFKAGGKVLLCGNGGSAADCQHMATELVPHGLPAIALTTDSSLLTAIANDDSFDQIFVKQVQALGKRGDLLIAISTSGHSGNVLNAAGFARYKDLRTIALTGQDTRLSREVDVAICAPSDNTQHIQEAHLAIEHILCELATRAMADDNK